MNERYIKILQAVADGKTEKDIALEMKTTRNAVKHCLVHARALLKALSTTNAVAVAIRRGLID